MKFEGVGRSFSLRIRIFFLIFSSFSAARLGAQGTLSWQYDTTVFVVSPTDQIVVTATIFNSSDAPYFINGGGGSFTGSLQYSYGVTWLDFLNGKTVPGNGSLEFNYIKLSPIGGYVKPGVYNSDSAFINFPGVDDINALVFPQNSFQITIVVPEPSTTLFAGTGAAVLFIARLRKRERRFHI